LTKAKDKGLKKRPRRHDLRHTNASWLILAGVALPVIQRHLGHQSIQTTSDRYGHLDRETSRVVADVVNKALKRSKRRSNLKVPENMQLHPEGTLRGFDSNVSLRGKRF
jgi:site-specific recombinase XerC